MSKWEPNHAQVRAKLNKLLGKYYQTVKITWTHRRGRVYARLQLGDELTNLGDSYGIYRIRREAMEYIYPDAYMTSGSWKDSTWMVFDLLATLRGGSNGH